MSKLDQVTINNSIFFRRELLFEGIDDFQVNVKSGKFTRLFLFQEDHQLPAYHSANSEILQIANDY